MTKDIQLGVLAAEVERLQSLVLAQAERISRLERIKIVVTYSDKEPLIEGRIGVPKFEYFREGK